MYQPLQSLLYYRWDQLFLQDNTCDSSPSPSPFINWSRGNNMVFLSPPMSLLCFSDCCWQLQYCHSSTPSAHSSFWLPSLSLSGHHACWIMDHILVIMLQCSIAKVLSVASVTPNSSSLKWQTQKLTSTDQTAPHYKPCKLENLILIPIIPQYWCQFSELQTCNFE